MTIRKTNGDKVPVSLSFGNWIALISLAMGVAGPISAIGIWMVKENAQMRTEVTGIKDDVSELKADVRELRNQHWEK